MFRRKLQFLVCEGERLRIKKVWMVCELQIWNYCNLLDLLLFNFIPDMLSAWILLVILDSFS